mmetsp:Transcript_12035/g.11907  ORF Transcript_12035/g.11907 Transcript_12035/m.11907 type:complete len:84 (+) Transcript_12035:443-694(+)
MLEVFLPISLVNASVVTFVDPIAVCSVLLPVSLVNIPTHMYKLPPPMGVVILPTTLVNCSIRPLHHALSIPESSLPFSRVHSS